MKARLGVSFLALALTLIPAAHARAQIGGSGAIQGTVLDASGGALPAATVTATHVGTGLATTRQTTAAGVYALSPLAPGEYRVTVTLDGFQSFAQRRGRRRRPGGRRPQRHAQDRRPHPGGHGLGRRHRCCAPPTAASDRPSATTSTPRCRW